MNTKRYFLIVMLTIVLMVAFSIPVIAQQSSSAQSKEAVKGAAKAKVAGPPHVSPQQAQSDRQKTERERAEKQKTAQRVQSPPTKSSTPPGKASQTERQKDEKERADTMKKLNKAVSKTESDQRKNRAKTTVSVNKSMQQALIGE